MFRSFLGCTPGGRFLRAAALCAAVVAVWGECAATQAQTPKPNIVVILSDDAGYNEFGFLSALNGQTTQFETPNLDALAQQSVVSRQGYAPAPLCSPTRAGLLTGRYQQRFGFEYNLDANGPLPHEKALPADVMTMPQYLKQLGYSTGMVGKWHIGYEEGVNLPNDKGFDEFYGLWGGGRNYFDDFHFARIIRKQTQPYEAQYRTEGDPSEYDPDQGRYVTDAFGDESADYIRRHAGDQQPFFLYTAFTAPHDPSEAKKQDLDHFAHIEHLGDRTHAAMSYAMDRSVGKILKALDDPNGDGNTSDSIRDNTIIVYMNDNGGAQWHDNTPLTGRKGLTWEGGIRVPYIYSMPGVQAGVFDAPIIGYDVLPTVYAAAGGNVSQLGSDGVDLKPYFTGATTTNPHETLFWRTNEIWAARKGDWKLGDWEASGRMELHNLATDIGETTDFSAQHPEVVADILADLARWEATLAKPLWGLTAGNPFDHFVFNGSTSFSFWNAPGNWKDAQTGTIATMNRADSYANTILEFQTRVGTSYYSSNNLVRSSRQTYMLNEMRLTGNFTGTFSTFADIQNRPVLFVNNLSGQAPKLRLDATSSGTNAKFQFQIYLPIQLLDDFEITGDGTQDFFIYGGISDPFGPCDVTKSGTSRVNLTGFNSFRGQLTVAGGEVRLTGPSAAINGASSILVGSNGSFVMSGGSVVVPVIDRSAGGNFQISGGELRVTDFIGSLTNQGGNYSPGASPAISTVTGNFAQPSGRLTIELAGTTPGSGFDQLSISGTATLGGTLQVNLLSGFVPDTGDFEILRATGGVTGTFASTVFPIIPGLAWNLVYDPFAVRLVTTASANQLTGDYNFDGAVDAADYIVWRNAMGGPFNFAADGDGDGTIDQDDFAVWQSNFGRTLPTPASGSAAFVPEPTTLALCLLGGLGIWAAVAARSPRKD
jgi:autotransporter-associated beta strand protein